MHRVRGSVIFSLAALALMAGLWGCNGSDIDDPDFSDSVLIVDGVEPASVASDVTPTSDPNGVVPPQPPEDDIVTVKVRNLNRTQSGSGIFGDVQISSFDLTCPAIVPPIASSGNPASLTVPAEASADIQVSLFTSAFKTANAGLLLGQSSQCSIVFHGRDLSGEPILSQAAEFVVSFVDTP